MGRARYRRAAPRGGARGSSLGGLGPGDRTGAVRAQLSDGADLDTSDLGPRRAQLFRFWEKKLVSIPRLYTFTVISIWPLYIVTRIYLDRA